jgi:hypothetical protein
VTWRDALAGLSVANLLLIRAWFLAGTYAYFAAGLPVTRARLGLVALWLLLGGALALLSAWSRSGRWPMRITACVFALLLILPLDWVLRQATGVLLPLITEPAGIVLAVAAVALLSRAFVQWLLVAVFPIVVAPAILVTLAYAAMPMFARPAVASPFRDQARATSPDGARVVWLSFDELGHRLVAGEREGAPVLPAFRRLMSESFVASNATSPAGDTLFAIPSIFTGRRALNASPSGRDLMVRFEDGTGRWGAQPSVFTRVRERGFWTGIVGWYHPYCDALPGQFDACQWVPFEAHRHQAGSLPGAIRNQAQAAVGGFSLFLRNGVDDALITEGQRDQSRRDHAAALRDIHDGARALIEAQRPGLAFVHYPVPHVPGILDLVSRSEGQAWTGYFGNAVVADRMLAEVRATLEADGRWSDTILVITSDHPWRSVHPRDERVPFIVRFPGAQAAAAYAPPVSLLVLYDLLPRLVSREIPSPAELARYLTNASGRAE